MKKKYIGFIVLFVTVLIIPINLFSQGTDIFRQEGIASWYGREFEGRPTASGEIFDSSALTAAHPSLPFGTMVTVTNQHNNKKVTVRINDRGPFVAARIIDVSRAAAEQLDMIVTGTAPVLVESIDRIAITASAVTFPVAEQTMQVPSSEILPVNSPVVTNTVPGSEIIPTGTAVVSQPVIAQAASQIRLIPEISIIPNRIYRLQIGSYRVARNAIDTFDRLKNSGLNPAYERFIDNNNNEYFRVVLSGIRGTDVQLTTERIREAGFWEALIREEN